MAQHLITAHYGEPHVSAHEAALVQSLLYGRGRYKVDGMALTVPNPSLLHIDNGIALIDGRWYIITGGGENVSIPPGSIGMQRKDRVFLSYHRSADGIDEMSLEYVVGTPSTGSPTSPVNQHPASLFDQPTNAWIPFCEIPVSGYTIGQPTMLLETRALAPSASQCAECSSIMAQAAQVLSDCRAAQARAVETVRANEAKLAEINAKQAEWSKKMERLDEYEAELSDFAQILANQMENYMILGNTLIVPAAWKTYDPESHSISLQYAEQDGTSLSLTKAPTVATRQQETEEQTEVNRADIDFLMMMSEV